MSALPDEPAVPEPAPEAEAAAEAGGSAAPAGRSRGFSSLRPLRRRNFALLWAGGLVSIIGSWM